MRVRFFKGEHEEQCDLDQIPRIGDNVYLPGYRSGQVVKVDWIFTDENGFVKQPHVDVQLT